MFTKIESYKIESIHITENEPFEQKANIKQFYYTCMVKLLFLTFFYTVYKLCNLMFTIRANR